MGSKGERILAQVRDKRSKKVVKLVAKKHSSHWTSNEIRTLKKLYRTKSVEFISDLLGRTRAAVRSKIRRLELVKEAKKRQSRKLSKSSAAKVRRRKATKKKARKKPSGSRKPTDDPGPKGHS